MKSRLLKSFYVFEQSIMSVILDYSLLAVMGVLISINIWTFHKYGFFKNDPSIFTVYAASIFIYFVIMVYSGYLGSKLFAVEFEKNTIQNLFMISDGRSITYIGKLSAGIFLIVLINLTMFSQFFLSFSNWGNISLFITDWLFHFFIIGVVISLFVFAWSTLISLISKRSIFPILAISIYTVLSFFTSSFIPETLIENNNMYILSVLFPYSGIRYGYLYFSQLGEMNYKILGLPILLTIILFISSFMIMKKVKL